MARINGTKSDLLAAHYELVQLRTEQPTLAHFVGGRIEAFYKNNEVKINEIIRKQNVIREKYIQKNDEGTQWKLDEKGQPVYLLPIVELNEADLADFQKKQKEGFEKESRELLSEGVDFIV